mgnify:FL=1|tara:strand:- start:253 stop:996 length:744 start_codon:yes stop_codon:yes gene_type:complete
MNLFHCLLPPNYPKGQAHPNTISNILKWKSINEDVEINQHVFSYEECCDYIRTNFDEELLTYFINQPFGHFKSDLWRLCVLYNEGGVYADVDQEILANFSSFLDVDKYDFCGVSNMDRYNLSNGFIYSKKGNEIIEKNIELTYQKYFEGLRNGRFTDVEFIGGCYIMGEVIAEMSKDKIMPIGVKDISNSKCLFLQERGDRELEKTSKQLFWNSFKVYAGDETPVMNSRYESYHIDRTISSEFVEFK